VSSIGYATAIALTPLMVWIMLCAAMTLGATLFNASAPIIIRVPSTGGTAIDIPAKAVAQLAAQLQGPVVIYKVPQMIQSSSCTSAQNVVGLVEAASSGHTSWIREIDRCTAWTK
jgi:hypothetical protein